MSGSPKPWFERFSALPALPTLVCLILAFLMPAGWASPHHGWFLLLGPVTFSIAWLMYEARHGLRQRITIWDLLATVISFPASICFAMWGGAFVF